MDGRARRKRRQLSSASYYISDVNPYSSSFSISAPLTYPSGSFYNSPNYGYSNTGTTGDQPYYNTNNYDAGMNQYGAGMNQYGPGMNQYGPGVNQYGTGMNQYGNGMNQYGNGMNQNGMDMNQYGTGMNQYGPTYSSNYNMQNPYQSGVQANEYPVLGSNFGSGLYGAFGSLSYGYAPGGFNNRFPNWQQGNIAQYYTGGTGSGLTNTGDYWNRANRLRPFQRGPGNMLTGKSNGLSPSAPSEKSAADNAQKEPKS